MSSKHRQHKQLTHYRSKRYVFIKSWYYSIILKDSQCRNHKYHLFNNCDTGQLLTKYHNWSIRWKYCCPGSEKYFKISHKRNGKKKSINDLHFDVFPKSTIKGQELASFYIFQKFIHISFLIGMVLLHWISMILHT